MKVARGRTRRIVDVGVVFKRRRTSKAGEEGTVVVWVVVLVRSQFVGRGDTSPTGIVASVCACECGSLKYGFRNAFTAQFYCPFTARLLHK